MKFNFNYFIPAAVLFVAEVLIALYMHDAIIRPYGGDFLVVILIYCSVKTFFSWPVLKTAISTLIFSYAIEISQYYHLVDVMGWGNSRLARTVLGTGFSFIDLLSYTLGLILVVFVEWVISKKKNEAFR